MVRFPGVVRIGRFLIISGFYINGSAWHVENANMANEDMMEERLQIGKKGVDGVLP